MRKKNIINLALTIIFILIPIFSYGITLDELSIDYALAIYTSVTTKLLFILIISIDTIISVIIIKKNRNKNTKHYNKHLILLYEITLLIFFIGIILFCKNSNNLLADMVGMSLQSNVDNIGNFCIFLSFISIIIQIINIKCNTQTRKDLFVIFCVIGIIAILGIIVSGTITINNLVEKSNQFDEFHRLHPFYVG